MYYTIYKTTNLINGKFYIGKHQTKDLNDGYVGSGKLLKRAINKYGIDNFHTEILHICRDEKHMNLLEKILVVPDHEINYNLCPGGHGGFGYINVNKLQTTEKQRLAAANWCRTGKPYLNVKPTEDVRRRTSETHLRRFAEGAIPGFQGKSHTIETKKKISVGGKKRIGKGNGSYGTCWINNGVEIRKIKKDELDFWIELGYNRGRK